MSWIGLIGRGRRLLWLLSFSSRDIGVDSSHFPLHSTMWSLILVAITWLPSAASMTCPPDTGSVFIVDQEHSDRHNHCFDFCGNNDCVGVLIFNGGCVALEKEVMQAEEGKIMFPKHCVQGVPSTQIVLKEENRSLKDHTEKVESASDYFHCLAICTQQTTFSCRSLMFYIDEGNCLLNSANSDTAETTDDTEGYRVMYMERRLPGDSPCITSFSKQPPVARRMRGDFRRGNPASWSECVLSCNGCDNIFYGNGDCLLVTENEEGRIIETSNRMAFGNICKEVESPSCDKEESLYVARGGYTPEQNRECLHSCLTSDDCRFVYLTAKGCVVSNRPDSTRKPVIERICPGLGPLESGVLFEERKKCPSGNGLKVSGVNVYQCMALCLSHPTSSCDSISFHRDDEVCELLDSSTALFSSKNSQNCQYFALGIIKENDSEPKTKQIGLTGKAKQKEFNTDEAEFNRKEIRHEEDIKPKARSAKKSHGPKVNLEKKEKEVALDVQTKCGFSSITIKVKSNGPFAGDVFLRNAFESCAASFKKNEAVLTLSLNGSSSCQADQHGKIYNAVIVVKKSNTEDLPVITERDRMYTVTCDYSNHTSKVNTTRQIQIRDMAYSDMNIGGKKLDLKPVHMEMRAKRADHGEPVTLGQPVELTFQQDAEGYIVSSCTAENKEGNENLTLIQDGCPTSTAKDYIVRGGIKRIENGFKIPMRAFKFRNGDVVRISCTLKRCENCTMPTSCGLRLRRNLSSDNNEPEEQVHAEMLVKEVADLKPKEHCFPTGHFIFAATVWFILVTIEVFAVMLMCRNQWKKQKYECKISRLAGY